ncbi:putative LRR receptor-like serine/threonine-protein kinase [Carex littledalei]|uniref:non-specific serine/threonine protein kinase n=1 Tax=Carex littledalei TaxID=544730 RepID=A0A833QPE6_9POAL|nr:putative LRR receptor-like serine/threonine-protein kinase [Carex littledalei]
MSETTTGFFRHLLIILSFLLFSSEPLHSLTDKEVLLQLKRFYSSPIHEDWYADWNDSDTSSCNWTGIQCDVSMHVTHVDLSSYNISGEFFSNFSLIKHLTYLDLSVNSINGVLPSDLNRCTGLTYLNISHNWLTGTLNLTGLSNLETLDMSFNRLEGNIYATFPEICANLVMLNISNNNFTGSIEGRFDECNKLSYVDLSINKFTGEIWHGFNRLKEFYLSENNLTGEIKQDIFQANCTLQLLDISGNEFYGTFPNSIANCSKLKLLSLFGNQFSGPIPSGVGAISGLQKLFFGSNTFDRDIPKELLNCTKLILLDLSNNNFGGEIQPILGNFTSLMFLILHSNNYTNGIETSGILKLPLVVRLDLSFNSFSGMLPVSISQMQNLRILVLAYNNFSGAIPREFGQLKQLQALDLSFNQLTGEIPSQIGNLTSLLWLMLANNQLTGIIPPQIGNCTSLLWLNLASNRLTGKIPHEISTMGSNPFPTFEANQKDPYAVGGSGECLTMKRWIPASYPPFSFVYTIMNLKKCRQTWNKILKGYGVIPVCTNRTNPVLTLTISGYIQVSDNLLSGEVPQEIGSVRNLSLILMDRNQLSGNLPASISQQPLVMLNASSNQFSGQIPTEIGDIMCLQSLDLSCNNFSGELPSSLNRLNQLENFNVSYNNLLVGNIPLTGAIANFGNTSYIGDPYIIFPSPIQESSASSGSTQHKRVQARTAAFWIFTAFMLAFLICGFVTMFICCQGSSPVDPYTDSETADDLPFDGIKKGGTLSASTSSSSSNGISLSLDWVKVFRLDRTAFTYGDIVTATGNFSEDLVVGRGGYGIVYRGVLPDGRHVAVKKLSRISGDVEGEMEKEFRAEMEVLAGRSGSGWPHPNLVSLYGWCLFGTTKLLVYEYLEGGNLDDVITDWTRFGLDRRLETAIGVAHALVFLHHECDPAVVHRDVKASNVLLDRDGRAKVTDFGLARLVGPGESHVSTIIAGTVGYVAPEYVHTWRVTTKGDVYSFGMLLMELATGRRAVDGNDECLIDWGHRIRKEGWKVASELVNTIADSEIKIFVVQKLLTVALRCTEEAPQERPDMKEVHNMLHGILVQRDRYNDSQDAGTKNSGDCSSCCGV